jgi:toxin ParE1/3/4
VEIIWSPQSLSDIEKIGDFIAEGNPVRANSFVDEIIFSVERLTEFPESGKICDENSIFRQLIYEGYRLIYQIRAHKILIITVLSPGKDSSNL